MLSRESALRRALGGGFVVGALGTALLAPGGGSALPQTAPVNKGQPSVSGTDVQGHRLTTSNGTWSGTAPFTYTYRWLRCDKTGGGVNGVTCSTIVGADRRTYLLTARDVGHRIRSRVTATNADGSASANSNATPVIAKSAKPANINPPTISGTPTEGATLTASAGTWSGVQPISYAYQWRRCDQTGGSCSDISGATQKTYTLKATDVGNTLRVRVRATNRDGSTSTTSAPSAVISKAGAPSGATVSINDISLPNRLIIDRVAFAPRSYRGQRTVVVRVHVSDSRSHNILGALVFCEPVPLGWTNRPPERATGPDGWVTFLLHPSRAVRRKRGGEIVWFLRARKEGENPLGGVTARRLVGIYIRR
jgi:hypothetical protein